MSMVTWKRKKLVTKDARQLIEDLEQLKQQPGWVYLIDMIKDEAQTLRLQCGSHSVMSPENMVVHNLKVGNADGMCTINALIDEALRQCNNKIEEATR